MFSKAPVLHVPERFKTTIPAFVLSRLEDYFNKRDGNALTYPYVKHVLQNNLQEAIDTALFVGSLTNGHAPVQRTMIFSTIELLQFVAPDIAYGNRKRVMNWIAGHNQKPTPTLFQPIPIEHLDALIKDGYPTLYIVGRAVDWHGKLIGTMDVNDDAELVIRLTMNCAICNKNPLTLFAQKGDRWLKVFDEKGKTANMSRQSYCCSDCVYSKEGSKKMLILGLSAGA